MATEADKAKKLTKARLDVVEGVGGTAIYINDYRITPRHTKPLGGGRTVRSVEIEVEYALEALKRDAK